VALLVSALSGTASLIYEVAWTRSLVISMGSTVYAFTLILSVFILGLGVGSAISSHLVLRVGRPAWVLSGIQAAIALFAILLLPSLGDLPVRIAPVIDQYRLDYGGLLRAELGLVGLYVFIPTLLLGAVFPFTFRLASGSAAGVGRSVAAVYSWNTIGSIAGSVLGSFVLVPLLGLSASIRVAASINALASAILLGRPLLGKAALLPLALFAFVWLVGGAWDPQVVASGAYLYGERAKALGLDLRKHIQSESTILAQYWDAYGLTTVHRDQKKGGLSIRVNGKADASTSTDDMPTQRAVGHLGLLHHPAPREILVIGLGSGVTLGAVAEHDVRRVDCVEISPAGVRAAAYFEEANGHVLAQAARKERILLRVGDGRNAVQFADRSYDVIVSQPSNLWISGMANLFTRDFFSIASRRLAPGGLFCQWVQAYRLPLEDFQAILRTFFSVFPEGSLWEVIPGQDYLMLGSLSSTPVPFGELTRRLSDPGLKSLFENDTFPPAVSLLGHFVATASAVREALGPSPLLTDDLPSVEYSTSRVMFRHLEPRTLRWLEDLRKPPLPEELYPGLDREAVARSRDFRRRVARVVAFEAERPAAHRVLERLVQEVPEFADDAVTRHHINDIAYLARLEAKNLRLAGRFNEARKVLALIPRRSLHYPDSLQERAQACRLLDRLDEAERCLRELLADYPRSFPALVVQAALAEQDRRFDLALSRWRDAIALREDSEDAHAHLAACLAKLGRGDEARAAARRALDLDPSQGLALQVLRELERP
jgi:spermidine synthase